MNNNSNRYQELDALRGLAALMVVIFHFTMGRTEAQLGFKLGTTGVDLFFIISGFVIFMSLNRITTSGDFIINRLSRLYPTYWTCVSFTFFLISILALLKHRDIPFMHFIANMTMFQYYFGVNDLDGPYWTMIIEMIFYIGIITLFHFGLLKYINFIGVVFSVAVVAFQLFLPITIYNKLLNIIPLLRFIPLFFAGTIFYKIFTDRHKLIKKYTLLILCLICQIMMFNFAGKSSIFITHVEYSIMLTLYFILFTLFVHGKLRFIVTRTTLFLGKISFALYLIHQYTSIHIIIFLTNNAKINFWIASICISLPIVIGLATLITYYIEIPFSKKMRENLRSITK